MRSGRIVRPVSTPTPSRDHEGLATLSEPLVRELLDARLVGVLATLRRDGTVDAVPMWYAAHEDAVILATSSRSRKVRNLEAEPRATLVLHDSRPGYEVCGACIAGTVEIVRPPQAGQFVDLVHERYVAVAAAGDTEVLAYLESDDVALRLTPSTAVTWDERGSAAAEIVRARGWALPLVSTDPRP
jgi:PPOX class probable F420-dependent enzyme